MLEFLNNLNLWEKIFTDSINEYGFESENNENKSEKFFRILRKDEPYNIEFLKIWAKNMEEYKFINDLREILLNEIQKREKEASF